VSSESAFSTAGRILGKERTSLAPETLEYALIKDRFIGFSPDDECAFSRMMKVLLVVNVAVFSSVL
jgi:hypothetical protein